MVSVGLRIQPPNEEYFRLQRSRFEPRRERRHSFGGTLRVRDRHGRSAM